MWMWCSSFMSRRTGTRAIRKKSRERTRVVDMGLLCNVLDGAKEKRGEANAVFVVLVTDN